MGAQLTDDPGLRTTPPLVEHSELPLNEKQSLIAFAARANFGQPVVNLPGERFWQIMREHSKSAGIPAHLAHPHILKHSIVMQTIHSAGIENVRQHLEHKSISSTGAYLKISGEVAARAVMDALKGV